MFCIFFIIYFVKISSSFFRDKSMFKLCSKIVINKFLIGRIKINNWFENVNVKL